MDRHTQARKVSGIIYQHGAKMSPRLMDRTLDLWERLMKSGDLSIDTTEKDRRREEREREEAKQGKRRDTAGRAQKIKYNGDKALVYAIAKGGAIVVVPRDDSNLTRADYRAMLTAVLGDMKGEKQKMEKSTRKVPMLLKRKGTSPPKSVTHRQQPVQQPPRMAAKAPEQPQPLGQVSQLQPVPPARERNPLIDRFSLIPGKMDLPSMTPHQVAAAKCGVDINKVPAATLACMDLDQMKSLAAQQVAESVNDLQERARIAYIRDPRPQRF